MAETLRTYPIAEVDRRSGEKQSVYSLKKELNLVQIDALSTLEQFGWYLKFVRRNPPRPPVAVLCDPDAHKYAILDEYGELIENPIFDNFRKSPQH